MGINRSRSHVLPGIPQRRECANEVWQEANPRNPGPTKGRKQTYMKMLNPLMVIALFAVALTNSAIAGGNQKTSSFDREFIKKAAEGSLLEVYLGRLAQTHSENPDVRDFGCVLEQDHSAMYDEAKQLADQLGVKLPKGLSDEDQKIVRKFCKLYGEAFDKAFLEFMIDDHIEDIDLFTEAAIKAKCPAVRAFARDGLPVLVKHLVIALEIYEDYRCED
jgi:putative membrane protein